MRTIRTNNDLKLGDVLKVKNGDLYIVACDDNGGKFVLNTKSRCYKGIEIGTNKIAVNGGNSTGGRDVVEIWEFTCSNPWDKFSEACKLMKPQGRVNTSDMAMVWQLEDPAVTALKAEIASAEATLASARDRLASMTR